jgi:signal transduction histidine kinase/CheY-like chemotaxis protein
MNSADGEGWDLQSREFCLRCAPDGAIAWLDARARRVLGAAPGQSLFELAIPGTESKLSALIARARAAEVRDWEIALLIGDRPLTLSFAARPGPDGQVSLLGCVLPEGYARSLTYLNESLEDAVGLTREIARQRKELAAKNQELVQAYNELDESHRGVRSLHAELDEKSDTLRRAFDVKSRVVANVSHEFRTPLHTILGLSKLLLEGADGVLSDEQSKQIRFIRTSAEELSSLVNDLLDLSKAESGRGALRIERFQASDLFASLRGMLRPLFDGKVELVFDPPPADLELETDHGKLAQILRNLISNALKFTVRGEVRVGVQRGGDDAHFYVRDTGIGIAEEDYDRIFEEFGQIENPLQQHVKGTGLGLPLSRKLAELLSGALDVESEVGVGSKFILQLPLAHPEARELAQLEHRPLDPLRAPVLVVEDDRKTIFVYERFLALAGFQVVPARSVDHARKLLETLRPAAVVLDVMLEGESTWDFLGQLKADPATRDIPVLVVTVTNKEQKARALGADEFWLKPVDQDRLLRKLRGLVKTGSRARVLIIDDDEKARYLVRKFLDKSPYQVLEAATGPAGVQAAQQHRPEVILLDFLLEDMTAFDVLDELKADPRTRDIPVVIVTSHTLDTLDRERLAAQTEAILSKDKLSRELAMSRIRDALRKAGLGPQTDGASGPGGADA